jgi:hypothetical protein
MRKTVYRRVPSRVSAGTGLIAEGTMIDAALVWGRFVVECRDHRGRLRWRERFPNTVVTVGKNLALDTFLSGAGYSVTGPFMGLITSTGFAGINAADTMAVHAGWLEAGATNDPKYTAPRKTCAWSAASGGSKALSAALTFAMTSAGTLKGGFIVFGPGAVNAIDSAAGTLWSAGLFVGGDQPVVGGNSVNVSYTTGM